MEGYEGADSGGKCPRRKAGQPRKPGDTAEWHVAGGAVSVASLPTPASAAGHREAGPSKA